MLIGQAQVDRVQHPACAWQREIQLEMAVGVPGKGGDPVARPDAKIGQTACQAPGTGVEIAIRAAVQRGIRQAGDDLVVREVLG